MNSESKNISRPLVSVFMITYNHGKYISEALDGILKQQADFEFEIVVGEDCSTDDTRSILLAYAAKYPGKFKLLLHDKNIGAHQNQIRTHKACTGKYIALCEGDDCWTDPFKLQKQVSFLEQNPDFSISFHRTILKNDNNHHEVLSNQEQKTISTIEDLFERNFICTVSCIFRNNLFENYPDFFFKIGAGDWLLHILNARNGKIHFMEDVMAIYRIHAGGAIANAVSTYANSKNALLRDIFMFESLDKYLNYEYHSLVCRNLSVCYMHLALLEIRTNNRKDAIVSAIKSLRLEFKLKRALYLLPLALSPNPHKAYNFVSKVKGRQEQV